MKRRRVASDMSRYNTEVLVWSVSCAEVLEVHFVGRRIGINLKCLFMGLCLFFSRKIKEKALLFLATQNEMKIEL